MSDSRRIQHTAQRSNTFQKLHFSFDGTDARATGFWLKTLLAKFIPFTFTAHTSTACNTYACRSHVEIGFLRK